jgi:putative redox protein
MKVTATTGREHFKTICKSETGSLIADEELVNGGKGEGFDPHELFAASLASCTSITLRMYADKKQWDLNEIKVSVNMNKDDAGDNMLITCEIELNGNLDYSQKSRLMQIANKCPIHRILENPIMLNTMLK